MTGSAREAIFASVRAALARGRSELERRGHSAPELPAASTLGSPQPYADLSARVEAFTSRLESVGGHVHRCADEASASAQLRAIVGEAAYAVSDSPLAVRVGPSAALGPDASRAELLECPLGLTGAQVAIAETGTLVLASAKERHRLISLVPPIHVAVIETRQIVATLGDALDAVKGDPAVTFITGPSRTADIELTLVVGVHGPKEVHVLLIDSPRQ